MHADKALLGFYLADLEYMNAIKSIYMTRAYTIKSIKLIYCFTKNHNFLASQ